MAYVDGYLLPIPKKNLPAYKKMATTGSKVWRDHGALEYCETAADDMKVFCGLPFSKQLNLKAGETAVFAWVVFKNKAHRDKVNAKVMTDPRLAAMMKGKKMPFDMDRMVYGGFKVLVKV